MKPHDVVFAPEARGDLRRIYDWIADAASPTVAAAYLTRLEAFCRGMAFAPERGHRRDDVRPNLRIIGFERRVAIAFTVSDERVSILPVFNGGRDWEGLIE